MEGKIHQPPLSVAEQVQNLKEIGLTIEDEQYAVSILNDISYFRLIKAYSLTLKPKNGNYNTGVTFEQIVQLYKFNSRLRQLVFPLIEKIEVNLRCRVANFFSEKYGIFGYEDSTNFQNVDHYRSFLVEIEHEIERNAKSPFVLNFRKAYIEPKIPFYALVELFSFGTLSKFYKNLKNSDKKVIAQQYGIGYTYLESWIENISFVRNICAHYGRLYNARLPKTPMLYQQYYDSGIGNQRIFATLLCMKHLLRNDKDWLPFVDALQELCDRYAVVDVSTMGFPADWYSVLTS